MQMNKISGIKRELNIKWFSFCVGIKTEKTGFLQYETLDVYKSGKKWINPDSGKILHLGSEGHRSSK